MKILIVEDNETIQKGLAYFLKEHDYEVVCENTICGAFKTLTETKFDFAILDVILPDGNGFELYEKKIKPLFLPTLFLTAKDEEEDIIKGLTIGAEEYMTKPFSVKELLIRMEKILYHNQNKSQITIQNITFDMDKMEVLKNDKKIEFTSLEIKILELLFLNLGKVVSRNVMLDKIWESTGNDVDEHTVTVYIKRIREKLENDMIKTIKGIGYRIDEK